MTEQEFTYAINYIKLDAAIRILADLVVCDKINKDEMEETVTYLRTLHKEIGDSFEIDEEEKDTHKNVHVNEQPETKDEESRELNNPLNFDEVR